MTTKKKMKKLKRPKKSGICEQGGSLWVIVPDFGVSHAIGYYDDKLANHKLALYSGNFHLVLYKEVV